MSTAALRSNRMIEPSGRLMSFEIRTTTVLSCLSLTTTPWSVRFGIFRYSGLDFGRAARVGWVARVKPGRILFEVDGIPLTLAREALTLAAAKLPIKTRFIERIAE